MLDTDPIVGGLFGLNCVDRVGKYYMNSYGENPKDTNSLNTKNINFYIIRVVGDYIRIT